MKANSELHSDLISTLLGTSWFSVSLDIVNISVLLTIPFGDCDTCYPSLLSFCLSTAPFFPPSAKCSCPAGYSPTCSSHLQPLPRPHLSDILSPLIPECPFWVKTWNSMRVEQCEQRQGSRSHFQRPAGLPGWLKPAVSVLKLCATKWFLHQALCLAYCRPSQDFENHSK